MADDDRQHAARSPEEQVERAVAAQREAEEARATLAQVLGRIREGFVSLDTGLRYTYVNAHAAAIMGREPAALLGVPIFAAWPSLAGGTLEAALRHALATQESVVGEAPVPGDRWTEFRAFPSETGLTVFFRDITAQRQTAAAREASEARLRLVMEQMPALVWTTDAALRFTSTQGAALAALGLEPGELRGTRAEEYFVRGDPALAPLAAHQAALRGERTTLDRTWGGRTFRATIEPLRGPDGAVIGVIGLAIDVTEQLRLEAQLRQAQKMEAVGRLAGAIAHDFNNLLSVIGSSADFLLAGLPPEDARREDAAEIRRATDRATALTRQLLAFSRRRVAQPRPLDLNDVVRGAERMLRRLVGEDVAMALALAEGLPLVVADAGAVEQALVNLVVNARDAMPRGGRLELTTRLEGAPGAGGHVVLAVRDDGHGIPPEILPQIFEPFFTTKDHERGTGLGLSTVDAIMRQAGGRVEAESEPGTGATFRLRFPAAPPAAAGASREVRAPAAAAGGHETVLLVEDEPRVRHIARRALQGRGYTVLEAGSSAEALEIAARHPTPIHLLLTDVVLPDVNGRALADTLAERGFGAAVLYMSGYTGDTELLRRIAESGAPFLEKPFTLDGLCAAVRRVLDAASDAAALADRAAGA